MGTAGHDPILNHGEPNIDYERGRPLLLRWSLCSLTEAPLIVDTASTSFARLFDQARDLEGHESGGVSHCTDDHTSSLGAAK